MGIIFGELEHDVAATRVGGFEGADKRVWRDL